MILSTNQATNTSHGQIYKFIIQEEILMKGLTFYEHYPTRRKIFL